MSRSLSYSTPAGCWPARFYRPALHQAPNATGQDAAQSNALSTVGQLLCSDLFRRAVRIPCDRSLSVDLRRDHGPCSSSSLIQDSFPRRESLYRAYRVANSQVTDTCLA